MPAERGGGDILLISTADWDHPFWTNKQHVAVELTRSGRQVLYVDSLGLRPPRLERRDLARILRRLARALQPPRQVRPGLWVWSPLCLPWQQIPAIRWLNRTALTVGLALARRRTGLTPELLWTYSPLTPALLDVGRYRKVVYHAVDDIAAQPGMPATAIRGSEAELARRADIVFATAPRLQQRLSAAGARRCLLTPNVADADHFGAALTGPGPLPADLAALPAPRIGFIGAVSRYKLDFDLQLRRDRSAGGRRARSRRGPLARFGEPAPARAAALCGPASSPRRDGRRHPAGGGKRLHRRHVPHEVLRVSGRRASGRDHPPAGAQGL